MHISHVLLWGSLGLASVVATRPTLAAEPMLMAAANVFVEALRQGDANVPAPATRLFEGALRALQQQSGDPGQIFVKAHRVLRFEQQAHCGRIVFALWQPSSNRAWPALGGQLNICEDGLPPLRVCSDWPQLLVPAASKCRDGSDPHDTAEVAGAIRAALAAGDIDPEQARQRAADWSAKHGTTASAPSNTPGGGKP